MIWDLERERALRVEQSIQGVNIIAFAVASLALFTLLPPDSSYTPLFVTGIAATMAGGRLFQKIMAQRMLDIASPCIYSYFTLAAFNGAVTALVFVTRSQSTGAKLLYFLPLCSYAIRFGRITGLVSAGFASASLVVCDLYHGARTGLNAFLENDLVLMGVLFIVAWLIGGLVDTERVIRRRLTELASYDEVTGIANHRVFQETLQRLLSQGRGCDADGGFCLMLIDVDNFKEYNDSCGHLGGDMALRQLAGVLASRLGSKGQVFRYGGDEFAVLLPGVGEDEAFRVFEELKTAVEQIPLPGRTAASTRSISISGGLSIFPVDGMTREDLICKADLALYRAKYEKNRVKRYASLLAQIEEDLEDCEIATMASLKTLVSLVNAKDRYTFGHSERVERYAMALARAVGLEPRQAKALRYGAILHDIGKVEIDYGLLNKGGTFTPEEWETIKMHPVWGAQIVGSIASLAHLVPVIRHHHEHYDGGGYPDGLSGESIPLLARILCIADAYDAMLTERPYKKAMTVGEAMEELKRKAGTQFDPRLAAAFVELVETSAV